MVRHHASALLSNTLVPFQDMDEESFAFSDGSLFPSYEDNQMSFDYSSPPPPAPTSPVDETMAPPPPPIQSVTVTKPLAVLGVKEIIAQAEHAFFDPEGAASTSASKNDACFRTQIRKWVFRDVLIRVCRHLNIRVPDCEDDFARATQETKKKIKELKLSNMPDRMRFTIALFAIYAPNAKDVPQMLGDPDMSYDEISARGMSPTDYKYVLADKRGDHLPRKRTYNVRNPSERKFRF